MQACLPGPTGPCYIPVMKYQWRSRVIRNPWLEELIIYLHKAPGYRYRYLGTARPYNRHSLKHFAKMVSAFPYTVPWQKAWRHLRENPQAAPLGIFYYHLCRASFTIRGTHILGTHIRGLISYLDVPEQIFPLDGSLDIVETLPTTEMVPLSESEIMLVAGVKRGNITGECEAETSEAAQAAQATDTTEAAQGT